MRTTACATTASFRCRSSSTRRGPDAVAIAVEMAADGTIYPAVYVRRRNHVTEHQLEPHPLHDYESERHREAIAQLVEPLLRSA